MPGDCFVAALLAKTGIFERRSARQRIARFIVGVPFRLRNGWLAKGLAIVARLDGQSGLTGFRKQMISVALRLDDPSETSDHPLEKAIIDVLATRRMTATFAVIPFKMVGGQLVALSEKHSRHLMEAQRAGTVEIAMHGFSHTDNRRRTDGRPSEFSGVPEAVQSDMVQRALAQMRMLFGDEIYGFVPPWNSFDDNTLGVLARMGFRYLSAAWEVATTSCSPMVIVPRTCHLRDTKEAIEEARRYRRLSPMVIVVMHHHDFGDPGAAHRNERLAAFAQLLSWLDGQPDVIVKPLRELAARVTARDCMRALRTDEIRRGVRSRLQRYLPMRCFVPVSIARALLRH